MKKIIVKKSKKKNKKKFQIKKKARESKKKKMSNPNQQVYYVTQNEWNGRQKILTKEDIRQQIINNRRGMREKIFISIQDNYKDNVGAKMLNSSFIFAIMLHIVIFILAVIEILSSKDIAPNLPYDPKGPDVFIRKESWFLIFLGFTLFHIMWIGIYRSHKKYIENDIIQDLKEAGYDVVTKGRKYHNHRVYIVVLFSSFIIAFGTFIYISTIAFKSKINQERFREYLMVYIYALIPWTSFAYFFI